MKKCTKHSEYFPDEDDMFPATEEYFCRHIGYMDNLQTWCRRCMKEYARKNAPENYGTLKGKLKLMYWNLNDRCTNPSYPQYKDYGGRGIRNLFVSEEAFIDYVINELGITERSQMDGLVLDRIDNDGNYEPGNLRFTTHSESQYNRRNRGKF